MEITRHFTATTYVVHNKKVLMHLHKSLGVWLPVGGHVDPNETPEQTAIREIKEESGLDVELYASEKPLQMKDAKWLNRGAHLILEYIKPGHEHIDFIFYATSKTAELNPGKGETDNMSWLTAGEVKALDNIPDNARVLALEALELLGK